MQNNSNSCCSGFVLSQRITALAARLVPSLWSSNQIPSLCVSNGLLILE
ncbi:14825_t:CDS:1, partial [Gigaspora margarita]